MKTKNTIKTDAAFVRMVDEVARLIPTIAARKAELETKLQTVRAEYETQLAELQEEHQTKMNALKQYFANDKVQARLMKPGKKYGESPAATFGIRAGKPRLTYLNGKTEADIITQLQEEEHQEWLRERTPELNKAVILGAGLTEKELADYNLAIEAEGIFYVKPKDSTNS